MKKNCRKCDLIHKTTVFEDSCQILLTFYKFPKYYFYFISHFKNEILFHAAHNLF